jgi:hypothetical protein
LLGTLLNDLSLPVIDHSGIPEADSFHSHQLRRHGVSNGKDQIEV